jgi:thiol:disulfide interchange protein DsbD
MSADIMVGGRIARWLVLALSLWSVAPAALALSHDELLEPEKAFRISARALDARSLEVEFRIAEGYYMYRDRFLFATESGKRLAEVSLPRGKIKEDEFFGKSETYRGSVRIRVALSPEEAAKGRVRLKVTSQGCSDRGICYVPLDQYVTITLPGAR